MDPVHGYMANAETDKNLKSVNIKLDDPSIKGNVVMDERLVPHILPKMNAPYIIYRDILLQNIAYGKWIFKPELQQVD